MGRHLLVILALCLTACDEDDPATSEHCVMVRMQHINMVYWRNRSAELGSPVGHVDAMIARFVSANWQCFR
jgi:hypothetical protein